MTASILMCRFAARAVLVSVSVAAAAGHAYAQPSEAKLIEDMVLKGPALGAVFRF